MPTPEEKTAAKAEKLAAKAAAKVRDLPVLPEMCQSNEVRSLGRYE